MYNETTPNMKIIGTKNNICRNSSYKWTFFKIKTIGINKDETNRVPIAILFFLFINIFFSVKGNSTKPININSGNLTKSHIGMYVESRFLENIHFPNVKVHTLLK